MKKFLFLGIGSALMFTMGGVGPAQADTVWTPIHKSTAGLASSDQNVAVAGTRCAGCHRAHTAKAEKLLKQAQPALCYSCHSSLGSALDVQDGVAVALGTAALRGGGFETALIGSDNAIKHLGALDPISGRIAHSGTVGVASGPKTVTSRHQIDGTTQGTMWGNGAVSASFGTANLVAGKTGVTLECGSCHDPHGNGNYRILKAIPNDASTTASKAGVTPVVVGVTVLPVNIPDALPDASGAKSYTTTDYWNVNDRNVPTTTGAGLPVAAAPAVYAADGITVVTPAVTGATDGYITNIAAWCTTCHTRYLAPSGSYATPLTSGGVTDATFTYRHRSDSTGQTDKPNCIQCHVSHGSNAAMTGGAGGAAGVTNPDGTATLMPADSRLLRVDNRGTCEMCHNV